MKEAQGKLEIAKSTLTIVLLLINVRFQTLHQSTLGELAAVCRILERCAGETSSTYLLQSRAEQPTMQLRSNSAEITIPNVLSTRRDPYPMINHVPQSSIEDSLNTRADAASDALVKHITASRTILELFAPAYGISGFVSSVSDYKKATYSLSLKVKLPWWLGYRALILEWKIRHYFFSWLNLSIIPGFMGLNGFVSKDLPIVQACFKGDEDKARKLFVQLKVNPNDLISNCNLIEESSQCYLSVDFDFDMEITIFVVRCHCQ